MRSFFFVQAEDGIRDYKVTGVQTCALPISALPGLACGVFLIDLVDHLYDLRADWVAVAKARVEGQPVLAVEVHEVLTHFRIHSPLVQECDLVEPASLAAARVKHDGTAALQSAQPAVRLPLELDRIRTA